MRLCYTASSIAAAGALLSVALVPVSADATQLTASGLRCTIVGTAGNDVLKGTTGRDVICGRGGNDRINGRRGRDLIDAGAGNDVVVGGPEADVVLGGPGNDALDGAAGGDRIDGGTGKDSLLGRAGADRLRGGDGDDELSGGPEGDDIDGGPGFNICDVPGGPADTQVRCVIDEAKPEVASVTATPSVVDVSEEAQLVHVEAHLTDDTGVTRAQLGSSLASLISGTPRDGVWATTILVPRFITPGPRDLDIAVHDRVGRTAYPTHPDTYEVLNSVVDQEMPVLQSLSLDRTSVDVRSRAQSITATVHLTDDLAGPGAIFLCPAHYFPTHTPSFRQSGSCNDMQQVSGTRTDATYRTTYTIDRGAPSGTWNFSVWIDDAAGNFANDFWLGPDEYAADPFHAEPRIRAIPDGGGVFVVTGTAQDLNAPQLTSVHLSPGVVDTSSGAVRVTADIAGADLEGITAAHLFISGYPGYPDHHTWIDNLDIARVEDFALVQGSPKDGVWRATFVVPGGTPDGSYFMQVVVRDSSHFESWVSPDSGWVDNHALTPALAPSGNYFVVANS